MCSNGEDKEKRERKSSTPRQDAPSKDQVTSSLKEESIISDGQYYHVPDFLSLSHEDKIEPVEEAENQMGETAGAEAERERSWLKM